MDALKKAFGQYGRSGDGGTVLLNGKDADLDRGGQVKVDVLGMDEDGYMHADVSCYANICPPEDGALADIATEIVCGDWGFPGEWSDDYWAFHAPTFRIKVEAPAEQGTEEDAPLWASALFSAIQVHPTVREFDARMSELSDAMQVLEKGE
jgi:hypothetical protein